MVLLCSFSSAHMQLMLSSLICRLITLQKYTLCFREEAKLVSAPVNGINLLPELALLPVCSELLSELHDGVGGGWRLAFLLHGPSVLRSW